MKITSHFLVRIWVLILSVPVLLFGQNDATEQSEFIIECTAPILLTELYAKAEMPVYRLQGETLTQDVIRNIEYPSIAKKYKNSGLVKLSFRVDKEGNVSKFKVIESSNDVFDASVINGVSNILKTFDKPAIFEGVPVTVDLALDITFRVKGMPFGSCIHSVAYDYAIAGLEHMKEGNFKEAISFFTESISVDTNYYEGYLDRAKALRKTGQTSLAIKDVRTSLTRDNPEKTESLGLLGSLYLEMGKKNEALDYLEQALKLDPKNYLALVDYGKVHIENSAIDQAETYLKKALKQHHTPTDAWFLLGLIKLSKTDFKSGVKLFSKVIKSQPKYGKAYHNRGMCYARMRKMDSACKDWITAKELGVTDVQLLVDTQCSSK